MDGRLLKGSAFAMLCVIWGSTWLAIKIGLEGAPAFLAASLRFVLASLTLLGLAALAGSRLPRTRADWSLVAFVGVVLFTADYGLIYWGENNGVESGLSAILFATMPLQTALAAHALIPKERLGVRKIGGIALGFAGILIIFRGQLATAGPEKLFPMLAIVLSAACAAVSTVAMKRWGATIDPFSFNGFAMGIGAVGLATASLAVGEAWAVPSWPEGVLAILYLALAGSVVTFAAYLWLLRTVEATYMSFIALVTPIVAVLLGVSVGSESFDPLVLAGGAVTLVGIYISTTRRAASRRGTAESPRPAAGDPPGPAP